MDNTPVQNVQALDQFKTIRADFERMARLNKDALTSQELDQMAMDEVRERMGASQQGESPEALRNIKPANAAQAARLQRLLHARIGDLAGEQSGANEPGVAAQFLSNLPVPGNPLFGQDPSAIQQGGETGAQNIAGLYGSIAQHLPFGIGRETAQDAQEFSAGIAPDELGGNRFAQTIGDVAGGYAGTYPLVAGIEKAIPAVPLLGKLIQVLGGKLAGLVPEGGTGLAKAALQNLPREVATGETFQGLTGGPGSLATPQGQGNALGMAALGTGIRGLGGMATPTSRAQALNSMLKGNVPEGVGRIVPQEEVAANRQAAMREQTPAFMRNRAAEGAPEVPAEFDINQPFEEGAIPQAPTPNSSQDVADMYRQISDELGLTEAKGGAPEEGAGFRAAVEAAANRRGASTINPDDITRSLDAAAAKAKRGYRGSRPAAGRYRNTFDATGEGQPE